ncbi:hypothetical protein PG994_009581 [Apiospora phragmitis]|uniref:ATPase AAA-type core domain-containing protein n=1 Tax=Apiospora phragmitis TaxID=2905665 RepID=A0ABR1U998_9PEZI
MLALGIRKPPQGEYIDEEQTNIFIRTMAPKTPFESPSLILSPRPLEEIVPGTEDEPNDEEFLVMTSRAFGFVLRTRKWAKLDLTYLRYGNKEARDSTLSAFDRLELPDGHRQMVRSLVTQHFRGKRASNKKDARTDIIRGKGKGLIMLLHGAPGVGKTTTAEDMAELFQKPLFHITCGKSTERTLLALFHETNGFRWNGRQIRNACQTALALAEYDAHGGTVFEDDESETYDNSTIVELQLRHFRLVQKAYLDFDRYLGDIRGTQGDRRAVDHGLCAKTPMPYQTTEPSYSSTMGNSAGLNVNRYQPRPLTPRSQGVDSTHRPVSQGELSGGIGSAYWWARPPRWASQSTGSMRHRKARTTDQAILTADKQIRRAKPTRTRELNQDRWSRDSIKHPAKKTLAVPGQWPWARIESRVPARPGAAARHGDGSQISTSSADFAGQNQPPYGGQGGAPGVAGTGQGA